MWEKIIKQFLVEVTKSKCVLHAPEGVVVWKWLCSIFSYSTLFLDLKLSKTILFYLKVLNRYEISL